MSGFLGKIWPSLCRRVKPGPDFERLKAQREKPARLPLENIFQILEATPYRENIFLTVASARGATSERAPTLPSFRTVKPAWIKPVDARAFPGFGFESAAHYETYRQAFEPWARRQIRYAMKAPLRQKEKGVSAVHDYMVVVDDLQKEAIKGRPLVADILATGVPRDMDVVLRHYLEKPEPAGEPVDGVRRLQLGAELLNDGWLTAAQQKRALTAMGTLAARLLETPPDIDPARNILWETQGIKYVFDTLLENYAPATPEVTQRLTDMRTRFHQKEVVLTAQEGLEAFRVWKKEKPADYTEFLEIPVGPRSAETFAAMKPAMLSDAQLDDVLKTAVVRWKALFTVLDCLEGATLKLSRGYNQKQLLAKWEKGLDMMAAKSPKLGACYVTDSLARLEAREDKGGALGAALRARETAVCARPETGSHGATPDTRPSA